MAYEVGKEWARAWMFKRAIADIGELVSLSDEHDKKFLQGMRRDLAVMQHCPVAQAEAPKLEPEDFYPVRDLYKFQPITTDTVEADRYAANVDVKLPKKTDWTGLWKTAGGATVNINCVNGTFVGIPEDMPEGADLLEWDRNGACPLYPRYDLVERVREWPASQGKTQ